MVLRLSWRILMKLINAHLRQVARELDAMGLKNQRQAKLTEYAQKKTDEKMEEVNKASKKRLIMSPDWLQLN